MRLDAVVVGGGQAGLAMAWHLRRRGVRVVVLDAGARLGQVWRSRWDSLTLFTPSTCPSGATPGWSSCAGPRAANSRSAPPTNATGPARSSWPPDRSRIHVPGVVADGRVVHRRGVTGVPGLYFLGLSWQHTRGSALLGFVKDDTAYLADRIAEGQRATAPADSG
jgi:NAD(P)-binding Rossmann-like domain